MLHHSPTTQCFDQLPQQISILSGSGPQIFRAAMVTSHNVAQKPNYFTSLNTSVFFVFVSVLAFLHCGMYIFLVFVNCFLYLFISCLPFFSTMPAFSPGSLRAEWCHRTAQWWRSETCWRWSVLWGLGRSAPGSDRGSSYRHTPPSLGTTQETAAGCLIAPPHTDRTPGLWRGKGQR